MYSMVLPEVEMVDQLPMFVYGTLRVGQPNHRLAAAVVEEAHPASLDDYQLIDGGAFPWIVAGPGVVIGDLLTVTSERWTATLSRLDALEGFTRPGDDRNLYERQAVTVTTFDGRSVLAWAYVAAAGLTGRHRPAIATGDWLRR